MKLCTGVLGEGVIPPLFDSFLSPFGSCFFVTASVQRASLGDCLLFFGLDFDKLLGGERERERDGAGGEGVLTSSVILLSCKPFWIIAGVTWLPSCFPFFPFPFPRFFSLFPFFFPFPFPFFSLFPSFPYLFFSAYGQILGFCLIPSTLQSHHTADTSNLSL